MTAADLLAALALPAGAAVDHRIPKTALAARAATAADRRLVGDGVEALRWVRTLKPGTIAVPEYVADDRAVRELAVLVLSTKAGFTTAGAKPARLAALIHRAVPHPSLLIAGGTNPTLTLAELRRSRAEKGAVVLDGDVLRCETAALSDAVRTDLAAALALPRLNRTSLHTVYRGWIAAVTAANAAARTGTFAADPDRTAARAAALARLGAIDADLKRLTAAAKRETQLARRAELTASVRALREERKILEAEL